MYDYSLKYRAYDTLGDHQKRKNYDKFGTNEEFLQSHHKTHYKQEKYNRNNYKYEEDDYVTYEFDFFEEIFDDLKSQVKKKPKILKKQKDINVTFFIFIY